MENIDVKHSRFSDAPFYRPNTVIMIGGAGGIGSWLSLLLARVGCEVWIVDNDIIDEVNMAGQLYRISDIDIAKVTAMKLTLNEFAPLANVYGVNAKVTEDSNYSAQYTFSAFDNMTARKILFEQWASNPDRKAFFDGRMLMESGQVFTVLPGMEDEYRKELFDDSEVEDQPCSAKATSHSGALIASLMVASFNNIIAKEIDEDSPRAFSFKMTYNLPLLMFET